MEYYTLDHLTSGGCESYSGLPRGDLSQYIVMELSQNVTVIIHPACPQSIRDAFLDALAQELEL